MNPSRNLIALCLFLTGCTNPPAPAIQEAIATSQPTSRTSAIATDAGDDRNVLDAVLNDLLTSNETPLARRHVPPAEILLSAKPSSYPRTAEQVLKRHDKKQWDALSPEQLAAATEAADALVRRHKAGDSLPAAAPRDARVKLQTEPAGTQPRTRHPLADRPVLAYPPGYSIDGQFAVVALSLPWSMHHADATYLLARDGAGWRIVLRQFVYYV